MVKGHRTRNEWLTGCARAFDEAVANGWDYVRIPLTQGQTTLIDLEDYELVRDAGMWCVYQVYWSGGVRYYARGYARDSRPLLNRFLLKPPDDMNCFYINGDSLDNRRVNLRLATHSENRGTRRKGVGGSSHYKGVSWDTKWEKWRVHINRRGYENERDAALAYNKMAATLYGEFAVLNDVEESEAMS